MRICFFSSGNSLQGGAERRQVQIVGHLLASGHTVHVVLPAASELTERYRRMGAVVHLIYWQHLRTLADPLHVLQYLLWMPIITVRLARLLRAMRIEVLHVNEILDFQGLVAARLARVRSVIFIRFILPQRWIRRALAWIVVALADRVVCVSQAVHRMALAGRRGQRVRVIYDEQPDDDPFDPARTSPVMGADAWGGPVVGTVAKMVAQKGHLVLLEVIDRLRRRGCGNLQCLIVGGAVPGHEAYAEQVRRDIRRRGLEEAVHLVGQQDNVAPYLAAMDVVCHLPLCEDSFPAVPMEAAAMGKPVVSFRRGGIPEQLTHPAAIRLVEPGDIDGLVEQVRQLLDNPDLRNDIGRRARDEIRSKFPRQRHIEQLDRLYGELTAPRPGPQRRPRVMRVVHSLAIGGTEKQALAIVDRLRHVVDIDLVTLADEAAMSVPSSWRHVRHVSLGCDHGGWAGWRLIRTIWRLWRLIVARRPDRIHCSQVWPNLVGCLAALAAGRRVWVMFHGLGLNIVGSTDLWGVRWAARAVYCLCRPKVWAQSPATGRFASALLGIAERKVHLAANGVAIPPRPRQTNRQGPTRFVMVGRLVAVKNHAMAVRAMREVLDRGRSVHLRVVGDGPEGPALRAMIEALSLSAHVQLLGWKADVADLLVESDVLLQPSDSEGLSNSVLEAMAHGLAVVASDVAGLRDIHAVTDALILVPPGDQAALSAAVGRLADDPATVDRVGQAGREAVARHFSIERAAAEWADRYALPARTS
ncbi:hypothetical protein LCGC14_0274770 [marine sediment metagenome]|uniref:Glycosyltransferase subfamily 4-like N-terminal domain-containing protein n=1 Tax=marine sediment metagenome TaxID=412755 RepID=A0A0F9U2T8_9ZZZZ|nr:glycosyltransferase [Phycisphaerae bacterium]HDZ43385.1 glycosyltransferase [Phycisphaerae bacterium]